jgi:hypothetical protein
VNLSGFIIPIYKYQKSFWMDSITSNNVEWKIPLNVNCKSHNVVYYFFCIKCNKGYVDMTSRDLSLRFSEHLQKIRNKPEIIQTVHLHFIICGVHNARILPLVICNHNNDLPLFENVMIKKLKPEFNIKDAKFKQINGEYFLDRG